MSRRFPTPLDVVDTLACHMRSHGWTWPARDVGPIRRQDGPAFMDTRYFDMTLDDGRVYRVRVSDITPEDAQSERVTEGSGT